MCKVRVRAGVGGQKKQQNPGITLTGNISYLGLAYFLIITELVNKGVQSYLCLTDHNVILRTLACWCCIWICIGGCFLQIHVTLLSS